MVAILVMLRRAPLFVIVAAIAAFLLVSLGYDLVRVVLTAIFVAIFVVFMRRVLGL